MWHSFSPCAQAVALKYVHKFGMGERGPPGQRVSSILQTPGELSVRTCGMLLKYVRLYRLEQRYPLAQLLERAAPLRGD